MDVIPSTLRFLLPTCGESIITSDLSVQQVALIQLSNSLLKKYEPAGVNHAADKAALDLFIESNARCANWQPDENSYHYGTMLRARAKLHRRLFSGALQASRITLRGALDRLRPGPGSSQGTKHTDFVGKLFHSKLTAYDSRLWEYYKSNLPFTWRLAETTRERQYGGVEVVPASRLTYAKKNYEISRVINTEASLEMLFQLGIAEQIEECLEDWFNINLSKQPTINRFLAKLGSLYGSHGTIDLKSASDLIAKAFVEWFVPRQLFQTLVSVRAKCIVTPSGEEVELNTFSTMGNGFTFALQTLIFACIVEAAYEELGLPTDNSGLIPAFSVFGDDIICVKHAFDKVVSLLEWCGATVNRTKSFNSGSFRESCGGDYFKGHDVRGIYLKKLTHETHYYSVFNRLTRWSARMRVDITECLAYLSGFCPLRAVPFDEQDISGIKLPRSLSGKHASGTGAIRYTCYVTEAASRSTKIYESNPFSLLVGALGGYVDGTGRPVACKSGSVAYDSLYKPMGDKPTGSVTLRAKPDGDPRVKLKRKSTPSWDWIPHKGLTTLDYELVLLPAVMQNFKSNGSPVNCKQ